MLMYHPAQDINHCVFRVLLITEESEHDKIRIDVYRLIDFYTLFPYLLRLIVKLPSPLHRFKSKFNDIPEPFESLKNTKRIIYELEQLQSTAIQNLVAKGLLDSESFNEGYLKRTDKELPENFSDVIKDSRLLKEEWFEVLINEFPKAKLTGSNGLKARTGLMEYRYDLEKS